MRFRLLQITALFALTACSTADKPADTDEPAEFGSSCSMNGDCADGLICATGAGRICTAACDADSDCLGRFGAPCIGALGVCAAECSGNSDCDDGMVCSDDGGYYTVSWCRSDDACLASMDFCEEREQIASLACTSSTSCPGDQLCCIDGRSDKTPSCVARSACDEEVCPKDGAGSTGSTCSMLQADDYLCDILDHALFGVCRPFP